ncbi:MAG: AraC family transcriptional regulator [Ramlibacter sp.]|nr:AraC family transcriptional regulator [Ramlibacter sp.]
MDPLSRLLSRFTVTAGVFYTGRICGVHPFAADRHRGHLHLIEHGPVDLVDDQGRSERIDQPTLVYLPRPERHSLVADDAQGAKVLCATVQFGGGDNHNPVSDSLPALVKVRLDELEGSAAILGLVANEAFQEQMGAQAAIDRLCELLIIKLLRHCLNAGLTTGGMLAGLADARLAKALAAMHRDPMHHWTLVALANEAGMSRARFAARFHEVTGSTPADYLTGWRISCAQKLLKSGRSVKQVSAEAGYGSSSALTRAFIRKVGAAPSEWLRTLEAREGRDSDHAAH